MPASNNLSAKKILPLIYVIDVSGSMNGDRITAVNNAMNDCKVIMAEKAEDLPEAELKVAVLVFSNGAKWLTGDTLVSINDFYWNDATAFGMTDLGAALNQLNKKMSKDELFTDEIGYKLPVIIFMSDGYPTDNWEKELTDANEQNKWFKRARKVAIAIGDQADVSVLTKVVGSSEAILTTNDTAKLKDYIVALSIGSIIQGSRPLINSGEATGATIVEGVKKDEDYTSLDSNEQDNNPVYDDSQDDTPEIDASGWPVDDYD